MAKKDKYIFCEEIDSKISGFALVLAFQCLEGKIWNGVEYFK